MSLVVSLKKKDVLFRCAVIDRREIRGASFRRATPPDAEEEVFPNRVIKQILDSYFSAVWFEKEKNWKQRLEPFLGNGEESLWVHLGRFQDRARPLSDA